MVEISVVIPVYNCEEFLDDSLGGILNQTFEDLEVICVDDGSTDNSLKKLEEFAENDSRVKVFHQENQGGGDARNFGLTKTTGKYLYFMDADDIIYPEALEECHKLCEKNDLDFVLFKAISYFEVTGQYEEHDYFTMGKLYECVGDEVFSFEDVGDLLFEFSVTPWGKLYNRQFVIDSGAQFAHRISFHDNKFFWEMLFNSKRIQFLNETYYVRRIHPKSLIGSRDRKFFNVFIAYDQIFEIFRKYNQFERYKTPLYNWKISILYFRFQKIAEEFKQEFLDRTREEIQKMIDEDGKQTVENLLTAQNRVIYDSIFEADTYKEFSLLMKVDELSRKLNYMKNKNAKLQKDYDKVKKTNDDLMNSTSWKLTKPLRGIRNIKK